MVSSWLAWMNLKYGNIKPLKYFLFVPQGQWCHGSWSTWLPSCSLKVIQCELWKLFISYNYYKSSNIRSNVLIDNPIISCVLLCVTYSVPSSDCRTRFACLKTLISNSLFWALQSSSRADFIKTAGAVLGGVVTLSHYACSGDFRSLKELMIEHYIDLEPTALKPK